MEERAASLLRSLRGRAEPVRSGGLLDLTGVPDAAHASRVRAASTPSVVPPSVDTTPSDDAHARPSTRTGTIAGRSRLGGGLRSISHAGGRRRTRADPVLKIATPPHAAACTRGASPDRYAPPADWWQPIAPLVDAWVASAGAHCERPPFYVLGAPAEGGERGRPRTHGAFATTRRRGVGRRGRSGPG